MLVSFYQTSKYHPESDLPTKVFVRLTYLLRIVTEVESWELFNTDTKQSSSVYNKPMHYSRDIAVAWKCEGDNLLLYNFYFIFKWEAFKSSVVGVDGELNVYNGIFISTKIVPQSSGKVLSAWLLSVYLLVRFDLCCRAARQLIFLHLSLMKFLQNLGS